MFAAIANARALFATSVAILNVWVAFPVAAASVEVEPMSFERAVRSVRAERDIAASVAALDQYARQGHGDSRLLLGMLLLEGKLVPKDAPLGLALVRLGAETSDLTFNRSVRQKIANLVLVHELTMTGKELIASDRLVGVILHDTNRYLLGQFGVALGTVVPTRPVALVPSIQFGEETVWVQLPAAGATDPYVRRGCAAAPGPTCPAGGDTSGSARCTGEIGPVDTVATPGENPRHLVTPTYPDSARRSGVEGTVTFAAHVDSSGLLCSAVVLGLREPRMSALAQATLDAVVRWQLEPAMRDGQPVESLQLLNVHFKLTN